MQVQSFDFWDTLVAREAVRPIDIFQYMVLDYNLPECFQKQRMLAEQRSNGQFNDIYNELKKHYNWSDVYTNYVKQLEIITEIKYIIPIEENLSRVNDGDIIVSDMYLPEEAFRDILKFIGFDKKVTFIITPGGKANGSIWPELLKTYNIKLHLGDNPHSDIITAKQFNIPTELTTLSNFTKAEQYFIERKEIKAIGHVLRRLRLSTPFNSPDEKAIWFDMANHVIPVIVFFCSFVDKIAKEKCLSKIRFLTRDNNLTQRIFELLYPNYTVKSFVSSRYLNKSNDSAYKQYISKNYDDSTLLVDLHGSFNTGRDLFIEVFGKLPNIVVFTYQTDINKCFNTFYYLFKTNEIQYTFTYENYVQPYIGKNLGIRSTSTLINDVNEYTYSYVVQRIIDTFVNSLPLIQTSLSPEKFDYVWLKQFINETPLISVNYIEHPDKIDHNLIKPPSMKQSLTQLANKYKSDKGDEYKCAHHYSLKYEEILSKLKTNPIDLLEIGLNRDNSTSIPSLQIWNDFFNGKINITGFDIQPEFIKFNGLFKNINIFIGDQSNQTDLDQLKNKQYDIIIDDGYHASKHQQISFKSLWENVKPGGYYVIEDLHWQPQPESGMLTKTLFENWERGNWIESDYITAIDIYSISQSIESIKFYDSKSKLWGDKVKNAFVYVKKNDRPNIL